MKVSSIGRLVRTAAAAGAVWMVTLPAVGIAAPTTTTSVPAGTPRPLPQVFDEAKTWVMGIIAVVASLYLVAGAARYVIAGGDPGEVERAKNTMRNALYGYALALLAPVILAVLERIVLG